MIANSREDRVQRANERRESGSQEKVPTKRITHATTIVFMEGIPSRKRCSGESEGEGKGNSHFSASSGTGTATITAEITKLPNLVNRLNAKALNTRFHRTPRASFT